MDDVHNQCPESFPSESDQVGSEVLEFPLRLKAILRDCDVSNLVSFGKFLVDLAGLLTLRIVLEIATYFEFPSGIVDHLERAEYPGQLLVNYLEEKGLITPTDISQLLQALQDLNLNGVKEKVSSFFTPPPRSNFIRDNFEKFKRYLKCAYELLYNAVQPIPYLRDKLYCVNEVFVEGGIELYRVAKKCKTPCDTLKKSGRTENEQLSSYRDIFDNRLIASNRIVVEGEPGYGKSTLTLQTAYDWCEKHPSSALKDVELFILLPLRLLKGITSIFTAIKLFLLPRECNITESEIKEMMIRCTRLVIVLDGFDEYPDIDNDESSDVMAIIKSKMFGNIRVVICTRSGCLPRQLDPRTVRVRLTGFDADARDRYIRMAPGGNSSERINEMRQNLDQNPVMRDLCQVPLFFVMFAHMAHEDKDIYKCDSVTSFFKYMIHCFYSHMWRKDEEMGKVPCTVIKNKGRLHKLAFTSLAGDEQTTVWERKEFRRHIGKKCFEELMRIGILVEDKLLEMNNSPDFSVDKFISEKRVVRFYHKLFAEWYAAHYLRERADCFIAIGVNRTLEKVNPLDLQFVFRFACGLNASASKRIVNYLQGIKGGDAFAALCILEQRGGTDKILATVGKMCSKRVVFTNEDNKLLQRSRVQLLDIAAQNKIPIHCVALEGCFRSVESEEHSLCLSSGVLFPRLDTLHELVLYDDIDLRDKAKHILHFTAGCKALKSLAFIGFILLPQSFEDNDALATLYKKDVEVVWTFEVCFLDIKRWQLNLRLGKWEELDGHQMTEDDYRAMVRKFL